MSNTKGRSPTPPSGAPSNAAYSYLWAGVLSAAIGFGAVYLTGRLADNAGQPAYAPAAPAPSAQAAAPAKVDVASTAPAAPLGSINPLSTGHMAAFVFKASPEVLPPIKFLDARGSERSLAEFKGKTVLLNLWATWCAPCRKEMPALERLQQELGSGSFEVVAISVDRTGVEGARKFLDSIKTEKLTLFADPTLRVSSELRAVGMPTTLLIDRVGREIGRLVGPAEWDSEDAKRLIRVSSQ